MASIIKKGDKWQARVIRKGFPPQTKSFDTKAEAQTWAAEIEVSMSNKTFNDNAEDMAVTLAELIDRYLESEPKLHILPNGPLVTKNTMGLKYRLLRLKSSLGPYALIAVDTCSRCFLVKYGNTIDTATKITQVSKFKLLC